MDDKTRIGRFLIWRSRYIQDRYFVIVISAMIGFFSGIAAYLLKTSVYYIGGFLTADFHIKQQNYLYVIYPAIGILLTVILVRYVIRDETRHGIPRILYVISRLGGRMKQHNIFSSLFGSSLTAGFGGSIGLEAPIISAGSTIGSSFGQLLRLDYKTTILLIGCGAAGAMASIFTKKLAERGELLTHHKDQVVLTLLSVRNVIDTDILAISPDATLGDLTRLIARSKRNLFPVVDADMKFRGLVIMDDVREDMFEKEKYGTPVARYILQPMEREKVDIDDSMETVMGKFNQTGNYNLVVLDKGKYVGFVSRANVFNAYRQTLIDVSQE